MKTILITGCSSGYGRSAAEYFLAQGWNVAATMRTPRPEEFPVSECLRVTALDVTDRASITSAVRDTITAFGGLDVVVNNAGIGLLSALEVTPEATIREIFETNVFGAMALTQEVVPYFRERRGGTIINVTSSVAIAPMPLVSVYCASKLALEGFSESLSYEMAYFGVRVKIVEPGYGPDTRFTSNGMERMKGLLPPAYAPYAEPLLSGMGSSKHTQGSDVAAAVWLAANDESDRLRYPAGPDAEDLAEMRRAFPGDDYLGPMRAAMAQRH